jgi:ribosomal protein S18 acetylase RimI-like enzyme
MVVRDQRILATASLLTGQDGLKYKGRHCPVLEDNDGLLVHVGTLPKIQKKGMGSIVVNACLEKAKESGLRRVFLATSSAQVAAQAMYRKLGFQELKKVRLFPILEFYIIIFAKIIQD